QRPMPFGSNWMKMYEAGSAPAHRRMMSSYVGDPSVSWDTVIAFAHWAVRFDTKTWRDTVDLREVPKPGDGATGLWLETEDDGRYRIGWFTHEFTTRRSMEEALVAGHIPAPLQYYEGRAIKHPVLKIDRAGVT